MKVFRTGLAGLLVAPVLAVALVAGPTAQPAAAFDIGPEAKALLDKGAQVGRSTVAFGKVIPGVGTAITVATAAWAAYQNRDALLGFDWRAACQTAIDGGSGGPALGCTLMALLNKPGATIDPATGEPSTGPNVPQAHPYGWTPSAGNNGTKAEIAQVNSTTITITVECTMRAFFTTSNRWGCGTAYNDDSRAFSSRTGETHSAFPGTNLVACKTSSGQVVTRVPQASQTGAVSFGSRPDWNPPPQPWTQVMTLAPCNAGETVVGLQVPPAQPSWLYQSYGLAWGEFLKGSIPTEILEGDLTFGGSRVDVTCKNAVTGETQHLVADSAWSEEDPTGVLPSCKGRLGDDWYMTNATVTPTLPKVDGEPIPDEIEIPDFVPDEWTKEVQTTDHPDWQPCETDGKGCALSVWIDNDPCSVGAGDCVKWTEVLTQTPNRVTCKYGTRVIESRLCLSIPYAYSPTTTNQTTGTKPDTTTSGPGFGQPTTTLPDPQDQQAKGECFPHGWGLLNPVEWVYKPVKCALVWAFVPKTPIQVRMDRMTAQLEGRAPFSWIAALGDLPGSVAGGGCPTSWSVTWDGQTYSLLCGTPVEPILRGARVMLVALMVAGAVYPLLRSLWYSAFPVVKPTPT